MDFVGQQTAERNYLVIQTLFGILGFIVGFVLQNVWISGIFNF